MKKEKKSLPRRATAQGKDNSKPAPGQESASQKSGKSKSEKVLRVATPTNSKLRFLSEAGLPIPEGLDVGEVDVALDLTRASNREIGRQHSMWASFHSYAINILARYETDLETAKRAYRIAVARFREKKSGGVKWKLDDAILLDKKLAAMADEIAELERRVKLLIPVVESYAGFRHAASREISRRGQEQAPRD